MDFIEKAAKEYAEGLTFDNPRLSSDEIYAMREDAKKDFQAGAKWMKSGTEISLAGRENEPTLARYGFVGTNNQWVIDDWGLGVQQVSDEYNNYWEYRTFHIHAGKGGPVIGSVTYSTAVGGYRNISSIEEVEANARLVSAAPLLLSVLIKAVEREEWARKRFGVEDIKYPDWYYEAKSVIEKVLNINTAQP
jgi:hypothetical protein